MNFAIAAAGVLRARSPSSSRRVPRLRLDLHNHTHRSSDGVMAPRVLLERARERGVGCLAVTDHDTICGAVECWELAVRDPSLPRVILGEEVTTLQGEIVGLYLTEEVPTGLDFRETVRAIRAQGGIVYLPHPYDGVRRGTVAEQLREEAAAAADIVEVRNGRTLFPVFDDRALALATRHGKLLGAGSDAHYPGEVGRAFLEVPEHPTRETILQLLRRARPSAGPSARALPRRWYFHSRTGAGKAWRSLTGA